MTRHPRNPPLSPPPPFSEWGGEPRQQKREADLAELEAEGAKSDVRRKVREGGEREMRQLRDRAQREIDRLEEVLDTFRKLEVKQLIADEGLYRELRDRFGE